MKKIFSLIFLSILASNTVYAAYAVHDASSIAQEAKSYAETAKLVALEAQKVAQTAQDLTSLAPKELQDILDAYKTVSSSVNSIIADGNNIYNAGTSLENIQQAYEDKFRTLDPRTITYNDYRQSYRDAQSVLADDTLSYQRKYNLLQKQLEQEQKNLKNLLNKNSSVKGNVQAQQIANSIAASQANIQGIQFAMEELQKQRKLEMEQAELKRQQNLEALMDKINEENLKYIENLDTTSTIKLSSTSPFEKYGHCSWSK